MEKKTYLYGARDTSTGKLVSNITNPSRKYWTRRGSAQQAINNYNDKTQWRYRRGNYGELELVTFELIEVSNEEVVD